MAVSPVLAFVDLCAPVRSLPPSCFLFSFPSHHSSFLFICLLIQQIYIEHLLYGPSTVLGTCLYPCTKSTSPGLVELPFWRGWGEIWPINTMDKLYTRLEGGKCYGEKQGQGRGLPRYSPRVFPCPMPPFSPSCFVFFFFSFPGLLPSSSSAPVLSPLPSFLPPSSSPPPHPFRSVSRSGP